MGIFEVVVLIPKTHHKKFPALIGFPGHGQSIGEFINIYFVEGLVAKGIVVFIPRFQAMELTQEEFIVSKKLLLYGFSLMGLRVYESLLVLEHIKSLEFVDTNRLGFIARLG